MVSDRTRSRCRAQLSRLSDSASDVNSLRREAVEVLREAIGFEHWCSLLLDPETLVIAQGIGEIDWSAELPRLNLISASLTDVNNLTMLARSRDHVGVLSAATGGDLARSERWREILSPYGVGDELRCVVADDFGSWGEFMLFRASGDRPFDGEDAQMMRSVSELLAGALRRHAIRSIESPESTPTETGVILLDSRLRPCGTTAAARAWFTALNPAETQFPDGIPALVWSVVGRLLAVEQGHDPGRPVRVRVRAADGRWAIVEASRLDGSDPGIAVTLRSAGADDMLALLSRAAGLTPRERELVALLLEGLATRELAERLFISRHTVQDHLKSVFEKVGVRSRRELLSGVFAQAA
jgi:DNA-binding CsgD family transcriptional regulator